MPGKHLNLKTACRAKGGACPASHWVVKSGAAQRTHSTRIVLVGAAQNLVSLQAARRSQPVFNNFAQDASDVLDQLADLEAFADQGDTPATTADAALGSFITRHAAICASSRSTRHTSPANFQTRSAAASATSCANCVRRTRRSVLPASERGKSGTMRICHGCLVLPSSMRQ